ncbi:bacillithiol biosynthesis cysteine-adding enzyme BshC [Paenibacillus gansuensis]|uniref:Putative cysteine ligase BshC n=1 Tax=Paenibacillus gansuensis TaxID=306542 RepID=A0ABW5PD15_9BACL
MKTEQVQWKRSQPLAEAYIRNYTQVSSLYEYDPSASASWKERAAWLESSEGQVQRVARSAVADVLEAYNRRAGAGEETLANVRRLRESGTLAVVGGQQAGLFTGPLLVIYKAVTILQTAKRAEAALGVPVVPVFWIAGEDHDFDEANHTFVLNAESQIHKLKIEHPTGHRTAVSRTAIDSAVWEDALNELSGLLQDTEFKPVLLGQLREAAASSATLSDFFARSMAQLFGRYGLVLLDSDDPNLRALEGPMFAQLIGRNGALADALQSAKRRIEAAGFAPAAEVVPQNANVFVFRDGERVLLQRDGADFTDKRGTFRLSEAQLLAAAGSEPGTFSNNVMTRPLMQDVLLPVLASVLGPGELAYWALTKDAFREFGLRMPLLVPRQEYTLVEGTLHKHFTKFGLSAEDALFRLEECKQAWLEGQDTLQLKERFAAARNEFHAMYAPLVELVGTINNGVGQLAETNRQRILDQIEFLEGKAQDAYHAQFDASLRHWERIGAVLTPLGRPQERVLNVYHFINKFGEDWLHGLIGREPQTSKDHQIVYL